MIIRREGSDDVQAVEAIVSAAFRRDDGSEPTEVQLLDELRRCAGWIPELSLVATVDTEVVGHAVCTRGHIGSVSCVGLGPIAVTPALQHRGVGLALMHAMLGAAEALDEPLIALLGNPDYYGRYGFVASTDVGIIAPDPQWGEFFQIRTLSSFDPGIAGTFEYAEPFNNL